MLMLFISTSPDSAVVRLRLRFDPSDDVQPTPLTGLLRPSIGLKPSHALHEPFDGTANPKPTRTKLELGNPVTQKFFASATLGDRTANIRMLASPLRRYDIIFPPARYGSVKWRISAKRIVRKWCGFVVAPFAVAG